jgi:hypothetical protein
MARTLTEVVAQAVASGLITPEQASGLRALADEPTDPLLREAPRGFNWVSIAYGLGALLVVFACGWFLAERWLALGAGGVLAMVLIYAAVAIVASTWLERTGFPEAAGVAALVAVSLTPVAVWAVESLTGWWPAETWGQPYYPEHRAAEASRWLVAELATLLAGLLVLRTRRYAAVVFPIAVALFGLVMHAPAAVGLAFTPVLDRWTMLTGALLLCATADAVDRRTPREGGDLAFPVWTVGLVALSAAMMAFWPTAGALHHAVPLLALGAIAASLAMRRRTHLVFGVLWLFMYLIYLSADVFRSTAYFPLVLAALGGLLLLATVWLQRHFPALSQRLGAGEHRRGGLPGSALLPWLVAGLALGITATLGPEAAEERRNREFQQRLDVLRGHSGSRPVPSRPRPTPPPAERPPEGR